MSTTGNETFAYCTVSTCVLRVTWYTCTLFVPPVAVLTTRIHYMIAHMRQHHKDVHSRRGLEMMVEQRRKLLLYLRRKNLREYLQLLKDMNLRPLVTPKSSKFR